MRWPGHVPAGVVTDEIVATFDWYATLAALAEAEMVLADLRQTKDQTDDDRLGRGQLDGAEQRPSEMSSNPL